MESAVTNQRGKQTRSFRAIILRAARTIRDWLAASGPQPSPRGRVLIDPRGEVGDEPDPVGGAGTAQHPHLLVGPRTLMIMLCSRRSSHRNPCMRICAAMISAGLSC